MKKYIISLVVVFLFASYVFYLRHGDDDIKVVPPANFQTTTSATSSNSAATSGTESASGNQGTTAQTGQYKDGAYTGPVTDAFYGNMQVKVTISGGKITDIAFVQFPNDRHESVQINNEALPYLKQEVIAAQNASVQIISGATQSSTAFKESLTSALAMAK